jgi:hypothetical protein
MTARLAPDNQRTADLGFADIIRISPLFFWAAADLSPPSEQKA